jgi:hypothetical protein
MELLQVCLRTTLFQVDDKFFQQEALSPIVGSIFMEHFEKVALIRHNTNHRCGSGMLMTHPWSGLMAQNGYRIS